MTEEEKAIEPTTQEIINSIKDTPEMAALLNASNESNFKLKEDELGGKFMGKAYNLVDTALMETLGIKDRPSGKTTELVTNIAKENLALKSQLEALKGKPVEDPKPPVDNTAKDDLYNAQLAELKKQIGDLSATNEQLTVTSRNKEVSSKLRNAASKLSFNPAYSSSLLDETLENRISKAVTTSKEIDGQTIYYNSENKPFMELGKPMNATQVSNELFKDLIQVKTPGGNATDDKKPHVKGDIVVIPNHQNIKSFAEYNKEFAKAMSAKGLTLKDKKYYELQRNTTAHYKFEALPTE